MAQNLFVCVAAVSHVVPKVWVELNILGTVADVLLVEDSPRMFIAELLNSFDKERREIRMPPHTGVIGAVDIYRDYGSGVSKEVGRHESVGLWGYRPHTHKLLGRDEAAQTLTHFNNLVGCPFAYARDQNKLLACGMVEFNGVRPWPLRLGSVEGATCGTYMCGQA